MAKRGAEDYYAALLDLEKLDPEACVGRGAGATKDWLWGFLSWLFSIDRLDVVRMLLERRVLPALVAQKLEGALAMKERIYCSCPLGAGNGLSCISPRHLAEMELCTWRPVQGGEVRRLLAVEVPVRADWRRRRVRANEEASVLRFYRETESYIWELMAANNIVETLYNYEMVLQKLTALGATHCIDYGAGIGSFAIAARSFGIAVRHLDLASPTMAFARWRYGIRKLDVPMIEVCGDHSDLPLTEVVVCTEVVEHVSAPLRLLDAFEASISSGGYLVVSESCRYTEKFVSHLPGNRWLGGGRFVYELGRRGFREVLEEPRVHPRIFQKQSI